MSYSQMIEEDNDYTPYNPKWYSLGYKVKDATFDPTPWPPAVEVGSHTVDCATPYVVPVLGLVLGGVVLALALGLWVVNKIRPW